MSTLGPAVPPAHPLPSHPHPQELLLEFESEVQKREHGFRLHADSMSNTVLTHELKVTVSARASSGEATRPEARTSLRGGSRAGEVKGATPGPPSGPGWGSWDGSPALVVSKAAPLPASPRPAVHGQHSPSGVQDPVVLRGWSPSLVSVPGTDTRACGPRLPQGQRHPDRKAGLPTVTLSRPLWGLPSARGEEDTPVRRPLGVLWESQLQALPPMLCEKVPDPSTLPQGSRAHTGAVQGSRCSVPAC